MLTMTSMQLAMNDFLDLPNLASERLGAEVLVANDDFFAGKENLVKDTEAVWDADRYTDRGKWMDGWETRRRREEGHDWCILRLGVPGVVRGVVVDTAHFKGNYPESCSIEACDLPANALLEEVTASGVEWFEILPKSDLAGDSKNAFEVDSPYRASHVRLRIYPDGGVARLRVHGEVVPSTRRLADSNSVNLLALELGAQVLSASDRFFSSPENLLHPSDPAGMHDGWETKRRRGPGNDWAIFRLAAPGTVTRLEVDTSFFKGNAPGSCSVEVLRAGGDAPGVDPDSDWETLLSQTPLNADHVHVFDSLRMLPRPVTHLRLQTYPDGGVARLRAYGLVEGGAAPRLALRELNSLPQGRAKKRFFDCCGCASWAEAMADSRPFADSATLHKTADEEADRLDAPQWQEAFAAHPPIGGVKAERPRGETAANWSRTEQSGVESAEESTVSSLAEANRAYRDRFGFGFIVCATGKSADEMLESLQERLENEPDEELAIAATEERKIMHLRLDKLLLQDD